MQVDLSQMLLVDSKFKKSSQTSYMDGPKRAGEAAWRPSDGRPPSEQRARPQIGQRRGLHRRRPSWGLCRPRPPTSVSMQPLGRSIEGEMAKPTTRSQPCVLPSDHERGDRKRTDYGEIICLPSMIIVTLHQMSVRCCLISPQIWLSHLLA